jgi:hypothetical protein
MGISSFIPPIVPIACLAILVLGDGASLICGDSSKVFHIAKSVVYGALIAFSYIRYKTVSNKLQVEVDGYLLKSFSPHASGVNRSVSASHRVLGAPDGRVEDSVALPSSIWPPADTLGWTPFKSLPFNKSQPKGPQHFWTKGNSSVFHIRSIGYKHSKAKEPSAPTLYECIGADLVKSTKLVTSMVASGGVFEKILKGEPSGDIPWPWLRYPKSQWSESLGIPRLLIINIQLPYSSPSLWAPQSADSDPGFSLISYYAVSPHLVESLVAGGPPPPAVKLLKRLIAEGKSVKDETALKTIGIVENTEEVGFPDIVAGYNGKPVLVTKSSKLSMYPSQEKCEILEIEYDVRLWSILARKTLHSLRDKFKEARCQIGMVIEGRNDEELPEQLLGCVRIHYLDIFEALGVEL